MMPRISKTHLVSEQQFKEIVETSNSYAECCRKLGLCDKGRHGVDAIKKRCNELNIIPTHFNRSGHSNSKKYTIEEILIENSTYKNIERLKIRLVNENKLKYQCAICGNLGEWNNQPLTLQLDHINGIHTDHRLENLRFLCPNCHAQTDTYSGKNITKFKDNDELN